MISAVTLIVFVQELSPLIQSFVPPHRVLFSVCECKGRHSFIYTLKNIGNI